MGGVILTEVFVERTAADPQISGNTGLRNPLGNELSGVFDLLIRHGSSPLVDAAGFGASDAVSLAFPDDGSLELGDSAKHAQEEPAGGGGVVGVGLSLLEELDPDPGGGEFVDEGVQVP